MVLRGLLLAGLACLVAGPGLAGGKKEEPLVSELKVKAAVPRDLFKNNVDKPLQITSAEELAKQIPDKKLADELAKQVDFKKQELLAFIWSGSGGDKLNPSTADGRVFFQYTAGFTDDIRFHSHFFALKRGTKWEMKKN